MHHVEAQDRGSRPERSPSLINEKALREVSKAHVSPMFRAPWPKELRERWPGWVQDIVDSAESLARESYAAGFETGVREFYEIIENVSVERRG